MTPAQLRQTLHRKVLKRMVLAGWQPALKPAVEFVKSQFLSKNFGVTSSKELDIDGLVLAIGMVDTVQILKPSSHVAQLSMAQRNRIIRLGKYVLGAVYGDDWFWKKLPEWTKEYNDGRKVFEADVTGRSVSRLDDLTISEAVHVIRRLEQIEFRLHKKKGAA